VNVDFYSQDIRLFSAGIAGILLSVVGTLCSSLSSLQAIYEPKRYTLKYCCMLNTTRTLYGILKATIGACAKNADKML
jgi:hypothetical protein